jgi:hypothetical protein
MQTANPILDSLNQGYHNSLGEIDDLWKSLRNVDDSDYIESHNLPNGIIYVARIEAVIDPVSITGHRLTIRAGTNDLDGIVSMGMELRQDYFNEQTNGTLIAKMGDPDIGHLLFQTYTYDLSAYECNQITDYRKLYLRIGFNVESGISTRARVSYVDLSTPNGHPSFTQGLHYKRQRIFGLQ